MDSHGFFLRSQGGDEHVIHALSYGKLAEAPVTDAERALLRLVEIVTRHAYRTTDANIEEARRHGWNDAQIAEAVYVTALFAFFNRVADAFGIEGQGYGGPRPDFSKLPGDGA